MDIVTIVILALAFIIIFTLFAIVAHGKKDNSKPAKTESKPKEDAKSEGAPVVKEDEAESKEDADAMEILEEVTRGNYMRDRAEQQTQSHEFNLDDIKETNEDLRPVRRIQAIEKMDDDGGLDTDSILNQMDGDDATSSNISREFSKLSKEMKALIISNAMKRKDE